MTQLKPDRLPDEINALMQDYFSELAIFTDKGQYGNVNKPGDGFIERTVSASGQRPGKLFHSLNSQAGFNIAGLKIDGPLVSAPLAGISDNTFRIFCRAFGSSLNYTEMISSFGVHYNNRATESLSYITEAERPCAIQIFGCVPEILVEAAQRLEGGADIIDINMGCPVPKVLKAKSGGFLLTDEKLIEKIVSKITSAINKPLTVKIRLGWDKDSINAQRVVKIAEHCGAAAVTIHGRTVKQGFGGVADYEIIKKIKQTANIPIIVSGDINSPLKAIEVIKYTGCEALMIGRAARGRPWVFSSMLKGFESSGMIPGPEELDVFDHEPSTGFKKRFALLYLRTMIKFEGEERAVKQFRKYLAWIFKGVSNISRIRKDFFTVDDYKDVAGLVSNITG